MENQQTELFKSFYTDQEREACIQWFEQHMDRLPQKLTLDDSLRTTDLPATVRKMVRVIRTRSMTSDSTYSGFFYTLLRIRQALEPTMG